LALLRQLPFFKATMTDGKTLPKFLAKKLLPWQFDLQRKQGFSMPLASWLRENKWNEYFRDVLRRSTDSFLNQQFIKRLLDDQEQGRSNRERLFALVLFELWRLDYKIVY